MALRDVTGAAVSLVEYASGDPVVVSEFDSLTTLLLRALDDPERTRAV